MVFNRMFELIISVKKECPENIIENVRVYTEIVRKLSRNCSFHDNSWDSKIFECLKYPENIQNDFLNQKMSGVCI